MDFSHYIMHTIQHIIKCEQDIMTMMNQMFLFLTIRQLWRSIIKHSAETQSGLPLLPWSCYASVIQWDIIQYLMFLLYYNTGIISFLAIYNDTILCTIFCVRERLYAKKNNVFHML